MALPEGDVRNFGLVPVMVLALGAAGAAQDPVPPLPPATNSETPQPPAVPSPTKFRSSTSMVALNVTVTDGRKLVTGLTQGDFEVYEDGVQQQVRFFEARSVPLDVILLLDTSASMSDRMSTVHEAARGFMRMLRTGDRGAVVAFSDKVTVLQPLTSDATALETAITSTHAKGATALHNAIYVALKEFGRPASAEGEVRRQAIAVLSDGEDTSSLISFDDVLGLARRMGVGVYTIALQSHFAALRAASTRRYFSEADHRMKTIAKETGAEAFFPATVQQLKSVYAAISSELSSQYSIAYAPSNARPDGRYRRIVVRVTADPGFRPRVRAGYTADTVRTRAAASPSQFR